MELTAEERQSRLREIETIKLALYELDSQIEELTGNNEFLYDEENLDCVPGLEKARDLIGEYIFDMYKEVV